MLARAGLALMALLGLRGCYGEGGGFEHPTRDNPTGAGGGGAADAGVGDEDAAYVPPPETPDARVADAPPTSPAVCFPARTFEPVPARSVVLSSDPAPPATLFVRDLFESFKGSCGTCHVQDSQGSFHVLSSTFAKDMNLNPPMDMDGVLGRIFSNDPDTVMPPTVGAASSSSRVPNKDPYLLLGARLKNWFDQGSPPDFYLPPMGDVPTGPVYRLSKDVGMALTNLGNCIPPKQLVYLRPEPAEDLDHQFEAMTELPQRLEETDLTTFDSEALAQTGVIAFVPAYPLWSDNARKIRHIRVPHGKSIRFSKETQQFEIPDNTRFYKTFLKKVIEKDGSERYRKVETRIIVARTPTTNNDGDDVQTALFGAYEWSPDESEATLVDERLNNGRPFADKMHTLVTDEALYDRITTGTLDGGGVGGESQALALQRVGATRTYAIPSSDRCVQCHMGSPSRSFVLGFTPLQINRKPLGTSGVIEEPGKDELTQLDRLIEYGVITGVDDPDDILPLEKTQGDRHPRNDHELIAQGYMVGNCAHCHNPRGFPSVTNKATLQKTLSFLPGPGKDEGIFQMSLEKYSPRIKRDVAGSVRIPYITPSLFDYPGIADFNRTAQHDIEAPETGSDVPFEPKYVIFAPWRSLIYRAVDTPFAYSADLALFPHMPMNVPGFDCRLPKIMGDWMVSIPAVRKSTKFHETLVQGDAFLEVGGDVHSNLDTDTNEQPYEEVLPDDSTYEAVKGATERRLSLYHAGTDKHYSRYEYCPDTTDIVDYTVTGGDLNHLVPGDVIMYADDEGKSYRIPADYKLKGVEGFNHTEDGKLVPTPVLQQRPAWPSDGVPDRPHWVRTDTTDPLGPWLPRGSQWRKVLIDHNFKDFSNLLPNPKDLENLTSVVEMLNPSKGPATNGVRLTPGFVDFATKPFPYGLWQENAKCASRLANIPTVSSFQGADRPRWMDVSTGPVWKKPADDARVYSELPGAAIYNMVCVNCHGPEADSHGRQADTLQSMTGGNAKVANFRDGLFGPTTDPGSNFERVFSVATQDAGVPTGVSAEEWAARYMAYMALGGTTKLIPKSILNLVASTPVFGVPRQIPDVGSANMLGAVQYLCSRVLGYGREISNKNVSTAADAPLLIQDWFNGNPTTEWNNGNFPWDETFGFAYGQGIIETWFGDAELLARLCSLGNPPPVRAFSISDGGVNLRYLDPALIPPDAPIGTDRLRVEKGISGTNTLPWCISSLPISVQGLNKPKGPNGEEVDFPFCPPGINESMTPRQLIKWSYRGAINGGLSVFEYLKWLKLEKHAPVPAFDQCELLP